MKLDVAIVKLYFYQINIEFCYNKTYPGACHSSSHRLPFVILSEAIYETRGFSPLVELGSEEQDPVISRKTVDIFHLNNDILLER